MNRPVYHCRRAVLATLTICSLRLFAWQQGLKAAFLPFYLFIAGALLSGICFALAPGVMAAYLGFEALGLVALTDVRAYYGTMLIGLAAALLAATRDDRAAAFGLLITAGFSLGSAAGRMIGFAGGLGFDTVHSVLLAAELPLGLWALWNYHGRRWLQPYAEPVVVLQPRKPEDVNPLARGSIEHPYEYYRLLRDQRPVYRPAGADFFCISRYADIQDIVKQTEVFSSNIMGVLMDKLPGGRADTKSLHTPGAGSRRNWGINPVDVLAIQDPPAHGYQRGLTQSLIAPRFIKSLEDDVRRLTDELMQPFLQRGQGDFMQAIAWPLPMRMAIRVVGFPEQDYVRVKQGCSDAVAQLSGVATPGEFAHSAAGSLDLFRYCWAQYRKAKRKPGDNLTGALIKAADDPQHPLTDEEAVSIIFQILIAGSDSSASTMGNALKLLIENPEVEQRLRREPERIADFIEEVFRLESAFQGHFRLTRQDVMLHDVHIPKGSRVFLLWASANRDERFWKNAETLDIDRENLRRHVTFGYGLHACLGRELARMEIRIVLTELLKRTRHMVVTGPTPYVASIFARTLVKLPVAFERAQPDGSGAGHAGHDEGEPVPALASA